MKKTITFLAIALTASFFLQAQDDWALQNPATTPPGIGGHQMAFIGNHQVLLFGGLLSFSPYLTNDQTWVYDLSANNWTQKSPGTSPAGRYGHSMAYIGDNKVLLFGGKEDFPQNATNDDTWVYDLSDDTWTLLNPSTYPSARMDLAMASLGGDQVLLFGGFEDPYNLVPNDETWVYDLSINNWTLKSPSTSPPGHFSHAMESIGIDQVILFSGQGDPDDTWVYSLGVDNWVLQNPAPSPLIRGYHSLSYIAGDQFLLFGGFVNDVRFPDVPYSDTTWVYDLSNDSWTAQSTTANPDADYYSHNNRMASIGTNHVLLFSESDGASNETWLYTATAQPDQPCSAGNSGNHKIRMCHRTKNPNRPWIEICVDTSAIDAHLAHGDYIGSCNIPLKMVGIEEDEELNMNFMLYPNPTERNVTLSFNVEGDRSYIIEIVDMTGRKIFSFEGKSSLGKNTRELSLENIVPGMYQVALILDGNKEMRKLLVR